MNQFSTLKTDGIKTIAFPHIAEPRSGITDGPSDRTTRHLRLPYHLVEPAVLAVDLVIVITISLLAGIGYNWFFLGLIPANAIQTYTAIGVLTLTNVSAVLAARGDYR